MSDAKEPMRFIVGERGPEVFVPTKAGHIIRGR